MIWSLFLVNWDSISTSISIVIYQINFSKILHQDKSYIIIHTYEGKTFNFVSLHENIVYANDIPEKMKLNYLLS